MKNFRSVSDYSPAVANPSLLSCGYSSRFLPCSPPLFPRRHKKIKQHGLYVETMLFE